MALVVTADSMDLLEYFAVEETLAPPPMFEEPCRGVLLHYGNLLSYVDTSPMTAFVLSWFARPLQARLWQLRIRRASCLPPATPSGRLVFRLRRFDHVTNALAVYYTGCVCRNGSTSN